MCVITHDTEAFLRNIIMLRSSIKKIRKHERVTCDFIIYIYIYIHIHIYNFFTNCADMY